jgi:thioredoxin 1
MRKPELAALLARDFLVVKIDVGRYNKNLDVAWKYRAPVPRGIPTFVVLNPHGKPLRDLEHGRFAHAHQINLANLLRFFEAAKPKHRR